MSAFPATHMDLFKKKAFAAFTTLMPDGSPQTTPVWVDLKDGDIWVNSALGRQKDKNVRRDARKTLEAMEKAHEISTDDLERAEKALEKITHDHVEAIDKAFTRKETELLEV